MRYRIGKLHPHFKSWLALYFEVERTEPWLLKKDENEIKYMHNPGLPNQEVDFYFYTVQEIKAKAFQEMIERMPNFAFEYDGLINAAKIGNAHLGTQVSQKQNEKTIFEMEQLRNLFATKIENA